MTIEYLQKWITVIGLLVGLIGVFKLTPETLAIFLNFLKCIFRLTNQPDVLRAEKNRKKYTILIKLIRKEKSKKLKIWWAKIEVWYIRLLSKMSAQSTEKLARDQGIHIRSLIDSDGLINVDSLKEANDKIHSHLENIDSKVADFIAKTDKVLVAKTGLTWIIFGFIFQLFGAIPFS